MTSQPSHRRYAVNVEFDELSTSVVKRAFADALSEAPKLCGAVSVHITLRVPHQLEQGQAFLGEGPLIAGWATAVLVFLWENEVIGSEEQVAVLHAQKIAVAGLDSCQIAVLAVEVEGDGEG